MKLSIYELKYFYNFIVYSHMKLKPNVFKNYSIIYQSNNGEYILI